MQKHKSTVIASAAKQSSNGLAVRPGLLRRVAPRNDVLYGTLMVTSVLTLLLSSPAYADAETDALRAQIKVLEKRLDQLEKKQKVVAAKPDIEKRLNIVERKQEIAQDDAKAKADKTPAIEVGPKGISITSPDKQYSVRMRAYAQTQYRNFLNNSNTTSTNQFLLRSARPILEAKITDYFNARLMLDFGNNQTRLLDAYVDFKPVPESKLLVLRAGKFKAPIGLERWQSEQELIYAERGQTTNLVPFRDQGVMALGEIIPDQLEYQLSYTNGVVDLGDNSADSDNHKDVSGRIFAHPFRWSNVGFLQGLGLGVGGTYGEHTGNSTAGSQGLTAGYVTIGQSRYFTYSSSAYADGTQWRFNPQAYYYNGPFSLLGEYVLNSQEVRNGANKKTLRNDAWNAIATYVITGEDASFDGVKPANNFDITKGNWGAFEVTGRVGVLNVDKDAFPLFSSLTTSAKKASEGAVGLNWYLNNSVKLNLDFATTKFDRGAAGTADRSTERVVITQAQFRF